MRSDRSRPFTLVDAMILIAAIAIGMGTAVAQYRYEATRVNALFDPIGIPDDPNDLPPLPKGVEDIPFPPPLAAGAEPSEPVVLGPMPVRVAPILSAPSPDPFAKKLMALVLVKSIILLFGICALGCLVLRLRPPRPPIRRLVLRPGSAAFVAVLFSAALAGASEFARAWAAKKTWPTRMGDLVYEGSYRFAESVGLCVALVWVVLAIGRRWHVLGWPEWLGVVLGTALILGQLARLFVAIWNALS